MPFDGTGFPERPQRTPARPGETLLCILFVAAAVLMVITPVSMAALVDIVRYFQAH